MRPVGPWDPQSRTVFYVRFVEKKDRSRLVGFDSSLIRHVAGVDVALVGCQCEDSNSVASGR